MVLRREWSPVKYVAGAMAAVAGFLLAASASPNAQGQIESFTIDGRERRAVVFANAKHGAGAPVVFAFHGHGGNAQNAAGRFRIHELWPEAVVVHMQGEPGVQGITDPKGSRNGSQKNQLLPTALVGSPDHPHSFILT